MLKLNNVLFEQLYLLACGNYYYFFLLKRAIECIDTIFYIVLWDLHRRYVA